MDSVELPMMAGTMLPTDVAEQVADDAASLADAGILFLADSAGMLSPTVRPCWSSVSCRDTVPGRPCGDAGILF